MVKIQIKSEFITLGQFLKIIDLVASGGETKIFLLNNRVLINEQIDNRRGRKLYKNDVVEVLDKKYLIC